MFKALRDLIDNSYTVFHSIDQAEEYDAGCMIQDARGKAHDISPRSTVNKESLPTAAFVTLLPVP